MTDVIGGSHQGLDKIEVPIYECYCTGNWGSSMDMIRMFLRPMLLSHHSQV